MRYAHAGPHMMDSPGPPAYPAGWPAMVPPESPVPQFPRPHPVHPAMPVAAVCTVQYAQAHSTVPAPATSKPAPPESSSGMTAPGSSFLLLVRSFAALAGLAWVVAYSIVLVDILLALKPGGATMKPEMVEMARVMGYGNYFASGTALFLVGLMALVVRLNPQQDIASLTGRSFDVEVAGIVIVTARTRGSPRLAPPVHERDSLVPSTGWGP